MEPNNENSFWRSNVKMVPGRPSPTKDFNRSTTAKAKNNIPSSSFESYQKSVSDAWTLSEDELTKEYCILSNEAKASRRLAQNLARAHKNPIPVVHSSRHQAPSTSSSTLASITTNSATSSTANNNLQTVEEDEIVKEEVKQKPERKVSTEYG